MLQMQTTPLIICLGFASFVLSYASVRGFRLWAEKRQILDHPTDRGVHDLPIVRGGGLVIVVFTLVGLWIAYRLSGDTTQGSALLAYTLGAVLIANISWLDDLRPLDIRIRFLAHCVGAAAAIAGLGYWTSIVLPFFGTIHLGLAGMALTFLWIVGLTNAYNFMDGIDGIAGAQAVIAGTGWFCLGMLGGQPLLAATGILIASSSLGFVRHNWHPAHVFMGDVGSAFLGFTFAVMPLMATRFGSGQNSISAPFLGLLLVWPFVFDTIFTFLRRLFAGENVLQAHKTHLYQRLIALGQPQQYVAWLYAGMAAVGLLVGRIWSPTALYEEARFAAIIPFFCFGLWFYVQDQEKQAGSSDLMLNPHKLLHRKLVIVFSQAFLFCLTYVASFLLRLDFRLEDPYPQVLLRSLPLVLIIKMVVFYHFRLFSGWWRYVGISDLLDIMKAAMVSAPLVYIGVYFVHGLRRHPRTVFIIDPILTILVIGGIRLAVRINTEYARRLTSHASTIIVGAGEAGASIARELKSNPKLEYYPIGFVDDDPSKKGVRIQGIKVLGTLNDLPRIIVENGVAHVLIAIPSASGQQIQKIVDVCRQCKVDFKRLPALGDLISGPVLQQQIRNVRVEDLLFRKPVRIDLARIRTKFQEKSILITGAAGSIGSELAMQIAEFNPTCLVLFERAESDLHKISLELAEKFPQLKFVSAIGDILDVGRLREVMVDHRPHSVFHAAAYKHVPMMEQHCFQAVTNNIFGTYNVALIARQSGVEDFVLISSDKAVNPSNIMGVTKRIAELVVLGLQQQNTRFVSVRFGNVLGSKGSVVPLFEHQIANRKPVTVTDPEARRYFMTIPEAVQLVLQASTMGKGGEIFVLEMGEQIKIVDLANDLIRLSGLEPGKDIPIVFTGLRPGEKLFEELKLDMEGLKPTAHEKIRVLDGGCVDFALIKSWLDDLSSYVGSRNAHGLVMKLKEIVPEYTPSSEILALSEVDRYDTILPFGRARNDL